MFRHSLMVLALVATVAARIPFNLCEEGYPAPTSFDISGCTSFPCDVYIGDKITMNIGIHVKRAVQKMLPVRATIFTDDGESFDFPLAMGDACNAIENGCPKEAGDYMISYPVKVEGLKHNTKVTVRVLIRDYPGDVVACGAITTTIKKRV